MLDSTTGTNVRYIAVSVQCVYTSLQISHFSPLCTISLKMHKIKSEPTCILCDGWRERERAKKRRTKNDTLIERMKRIVYQKVIMHIWNFATQNNIIFCIMCVCLPCFFSFFLLYALWFFRMQAAICCSSLLPATIITKRMLIVQGNGSKLEKVICTKQQKLQCNYYLLTHVIWFLMYQNR